MGTQIEGSTVLEKGLRSRVEAFSAGRSGVWEAGDIESPLSTTSCASVSTSGYTVDRSSPRLSRKQWLQHRAAQDAPAASECGTMPLSALLPQPNMSSTATATRSYLGQRDSMLVPAVSSPGTSRKSTCMTTEQSDILTDGQTISQTDSQADEPIAKSTERQTALARARLVVLRARGKRDEGPHTPRCSNTLSVYFHSLPSHPLSGEL